MLRWRFTIAFTPYGFAVALLSGVSFRGVLSYMGVGILKSMKTTWDKADTLLNRLDYYTTDARQQIAIRDMGWVGDFNDFIDFRDKYMS